MKMKRFFNEEQLYNVFEKICEIKRNWRVFVQRLFAAVHNKTGANNLILKGYLLRLWKNWSN